MKVSYPVSANRYWRISKNRLYRSKEAMAYKQEIGLIANLMLKKIITGDVRVCLTLHPKLTVKKTASKTRIDLDNVIKVALDALNGIAYKDDKQVIEIFAKIGTAILDGGLTIEIEEVSFSE